MKKIKHKKAWFKVGKTILKNCASDLFNPPIEIKSESQAKCLYALQSEKGYRYS